MTRGSGAKGHDVGFLRLQNHGPRFKGLGLRALEKPGGPSFGLFRLPSAKREFKM